MSGSERTAGEARISADAWSGLLVDLSDLPEKQRVVSASLIRRLCVGEEAKDVDPRGIWIKGARIDDRLDLSYCTVTHPLRFEATSFAVVPELSSAQLPGLMFEACTLPGLFAAGIRTGVLRLHSSRVSGRVLLAEARIDRYLDCRGATLSEGSYALAAEQAVITGSVLLSEGFSASGMLGLSGTKIGGQLNCAGATLRSEGSYALVAEQAEISGGVFLNEGFSASGVVRLSRTKIGGQLVCAGATLRAAGLVALAADGAEITGGVFLNEGFSATGDVLFRGAKIAGPLDCGGATLRREGGYALAADQAEITGDVFLNEGFSAKGATLFRGTKIGGQLNCAGATLRSEGSFALAADQAEITGDVFLNEGFSASGSVLFLGAKIGGQLNCAGATLRDENTCALAADGAEITAGVFLNEGFSATGQVLFRDARIAGQLNCVGAMLATADRDAFSSAGAVITGDVFLNKASVTGKVRLTGTTIGGHLDCSGATLVNEDGIALDGGHARTGGVLIFRDVQVTGGVDLFHASATTLEDDLGRGDDPLGSWRSVTPLFLDGFAYERFGQETRWDLRLRRQWLKHTLGFQQGAWQQLIQVYRSVGRDDDATGASIAMHNDRVARADLPWYRVAGRWILWAVVGHGYRPWLAAIWATAIIAAFALVVWNWSGHFHPEQGVTGSLQPLAYAADTFLPIVNLGQADDWTPTGWVRWVAWSVILLGWSLSTIFVAGFTRVVRS
jgi:hypothetical protein